MPISPQRTRNSTRVGAFLTLTLGLFLIPQGCESIRPEQHKTEPVPQPSTSTETRELVARGAPPSTPPGKHATRRGYYVFYHDFDLPENDPIFADLEALPDQVFGELELQPSNAVVQVFLFDTQERYERYMRFRYKDLPIRRAYFLQPEGPPGAKDNLMIYTWMGPHLRTDLRHELTHALLHSVLKNVPLWLDEGLAGYFELPPASEGLNRQHLETLRRGPFHPDLARLERLGEVRQMEKPEYREAWAWVHLMLRGDAVAHKVLREYLQLLRTNPNPGPLLPRLREVMIDPEQELADHIEKMELPHQPAR
jgi:hypothetical protein